MANPIVTDLPIIGYFDRQRFRQFGPSDCANWYNVPVAIGKKKMASYPTLGRRHISFLGQNQLIFNSEPRYIQKTVKYWYSVVGNQIFREDAFFNQVEITASVKLKTLNGNVFLAYLNVGPQVTSAITGITLVCFADGLNVYLYREETDEFDIITDGHLPVNPLYIAAFGNRITVSSNNTSTYGLSAINLNYDISFSTMLSTCFTTNSAAIFNQASGVINQMGVLQNTLYIFTDFVTDIWSNIPSTFTSAGGVVTTFPWKKNTSYNFDYGISASNARTLSIDFGYMTWMGQNRSGLLQPLLCENGGYPKPFSSKAVDVLLQRRANAQSLDPFVMGQSDGFLYDYENTVFYRLSAGSYSDTGLLDQISQSISIEYNFDTQTWHRCIEANGERNRVQKHVFFANRHLVTVIGDGTVYEFSGQYYNNEIQNPDQTNRQALDAYLQLPFRYERVTPIIVSGMIEGLKSPGFYAEFKTNYVEIDFVWGEGSFLNSDTPFLNTQFIVDETNDSANQPVYVVGENPDNDGNPQFLITEGSNYPTLNDITYNSWFKPHIELFFSNDGGISYQTAGNLEFAQVGVYQWRMRWYQLGCSRNRVYKLICVSPSPIVLLGGTMEVENVSGGAA
jgi:hypothetical protein